MFYKFLILSFVLLSMSCGSKKDTEEQLFIPPQADPKDGEDWKNSADILRTKYPEIAQLLQIPQLVSVTSEFGPTVIKVHDFPYRSMMAESHIKPWSSWWYPKKDDFLFSTEEGRYASALTKYDLIRQRRFDYDPNGLRPGSAADFERKNFNPNDLSWEGLCDAWALASISSLEPRHPVTISENRVSVTFEISDLKALLLKTYEAVDDSNLTYYGQKFTGDEQGWIFPDLFPDQFHRLIEAQLFEAQMPVIMDHDPGVEVWNVPIFKANYLMDKVPDQPNSVFVRTWVYSAEAVKTNEKEFVGTKEAVREYNYVLVGTRNEEGNLVINSGYWVKGPSGLNSRKNHPDYLNRIPVLSKLQRKSWNPEIDIKLIDEILAKSH